MHPSIHLHVVRAIKHSKNDEKLNCTFYRMDYVTLRDSLQGKKQCSRSIPIRTLLFTFKYIPGLYSCHAMQCTTEEEQENLFYFIHIVDHTYESAFLLFLLGATVQLKHMQCRAVRCSMVYINGTRQWFVNSFLF